jgi:hypothetical protein
MASKPNIPDGSEAAERVAEAHTQDGLVHSSPEEEIRYRAYEIYLGRGEEPDHEIEDWLQAERELNGRHRRSSVFDDR